MAAQKTEPIGAVDEAGRSVDWWFVYKVPYKAENPAGGAKATGYEYLYYDSGDQNALSLSPNLLTGKEGAVHRTLAGLFGESRSSVPAGRGWVLYNDELPEDDLPEGKSNRGSAGHTKGVLGFDLESDSGLWLLHSTPRWPHDDAMVFPQNEREYGQTFLCITLPGVSAVEQLAGQMRRYQDPQTYGCRTPKGLAADSELSLLASGEAVTDPPTEQTNDLGFTSSAGASFRALAKSRAWGEDFWIDLVGPALGTSLNVETWRRGTLPPVEEQGAGAPSSGHVDDIQNVDLTELGAPYAWKYTKDHAKWAIGEGSDWVCVGDLNRQTSQEKRGGATIAFRHAKLNGWLRSIERLAPNAT